MTRWPCWKWLLVLVWVGPASAAAADDADLALATALQRSFDRRSSRVMVRTVARTDRAALDYAAYDRNPLLHYRMDAPPRPPAATPKLAELDFAGALVPGTIADRVSRTPLTRDELQRPLAWRAVTKYLCEWNYDAAEGLLVAASQVSGEDWGNVDHIRPLQEISTAYLHGDEIWARVEFRPEVSWAPVTDEDKDGYGELYGRMDAKAYGPEVLTQIRGDYLKKALTPEEVEQFFFELASDWYQELRTEVLEPATTRPWPNAETEPEIVKALGGKSFASPLAVMRGRPYEDAIYNVFLLGAPGAGEQPENTASADASLAEFHADVRRQLDARPKALNGLMGRDGFLFYRGDVEYIVSGDLREQEDGRDPYPAIVDFKQQLDARGIDLLMVFIPSKAEVYPEKLSAEAPEGAKPYVAPYGRKLLQELAAAGVEAVDLLPAFIEQRGADPDPLYMPTDTHWTHRGLRLAADLIAQRVRQYPWYAGLAEKPVKYSVKDVTCTRQGDICRMLTDQERLKYRPMKLEAQQVVAPGGELYEDDPESPIVMLGDSFTGVFHFEDCKHAGLSAHVARQLSMPIDLIMAQGSGPRIRGRLARRGHDAIEAKRLIIWTVAARDLYNYWAPWDIIRLP